MNDINHLILSTTTDYSTDLICIELEKRGLKYLRLNRDHFPEYEINYTLQGDTLRINMGDTWYELSAQHMANDVGTVLYGEEAVTLGIIDHVGGLSDALDSLYRQMDRRREE